MEKFEIKNYSDIIDSSKNIIDTANNMSSNLEDISYSMQSIYNDSSFSGPIADHCAEALDIINRATVNNLNHFTNNAATMDKINQGYMDTDKKVEENVGGV